MHEYRVRCPVGIDAPAEDDGPIPQTMATYRMQGGPTILLIDRWGHLRRLIIGHVPDLQLGAESMQLLCAPAPNSPAATRGFDSEVHA